MTDHPILFNSEMVRAIQAGRKTQTRRVIVPQPEMVDSTYQEGVFALWSHEHYGPEGFWTAKEKSSPYGQPGDRLWVRETWAAGYCWDTVPPREIRDSTLIWYGPKSERGPGSTRGKWRPSIHMPRWASRITLEVVSVRVERLQDISRDDCIAEGIDMMAAGLLLAEARYRSLWDSINAKRGHGWETKPWVWVVEFKVVE